MEEEVRHLALLGKSSFSALAGETGLDWVLAAIRTFSTLLHLDFFFSSVILKFSSSSLPLFSKEDQAVGISSSSQVQVLALLPAVSLQPAPTPQ